MVFSLPTFMLDYFQIKYKTFDSFYLYNWYLKIYILHTFKTYTFHSLIIYKDNLECEIKKATEEDQ